MPHSDFVIPSNLTLSQTLQLLYSIVLNQFKNYEDKLQIEGDDYSSLKKLSKALSQIILYLSDGINRVEQHYKVENLFILTNADVQDIVRNLRILDQDVKASKRNVDARIQTLISDKHKSLPSSNSHFSLSTLLKKTKLTSQKKEQLKKEQEEREAREVEEIKKQRKLQEDQRAREKLAKEKELEIQQAKLLELTIKKQVEKEMASRLSHDRNANQQKDNKKGSSTDAIVPVAGRSSLDFKRPARRSIDQMRRRSLDGGARSKGSQVSSHTRPVSDATAANIDNVNRAAYVAWAHAKPPSDKSDARGRASPTTERAQAQSSRTKYEYVKPVIKRPTIRIPKRVTPAHRKEAVLESVEGKKELQRQSSQVRSPKVTSRRSFSPGITTPTSPNPSSPNISSSFQEKELSPFEKRIEHVMNTLEGVDVDACQQILNDILIVDEKIYWDDIAGLNNAKNSLKETVVYPFLRPDLFKGLREPISGMLLFGPPGTGKSMIAKAVATESRSTFFSISASSLLSKYLGESEKLVRALFYLAKRLSPSIIFVDEIDSLLTSRSDNENESSRRIKTEVLIQWSSLSSATARDKEESDAESGRVLVLAATNLPWAIDEAARRRFSRRLYIPLPEYETRLIHLKKLLSHQKNSLSSTDFEIIASLTEGYSGSDITALAKEAAMEPIRELGDKLIDVDFSKIRGICVGDFEKAMLTIKKSVSPDSLQKFEAWAAGFGSTGA
ncbi:LAFE_0G14048g1_1 [Lachancea fermentati]|uniref:LAFE_0G14048g1_1 n=1 Tax=Lachancea fermentati TaxID=4955 RepID=A0A1G4MI96_LACFM|nr:LAFE_0G14048g1_1 [Lachancea fermentati]